MDGQASASVLQLSTFTKVQSIPKKERYGDFPVTVRVAAPTMTVHQQAPVDIVAVVDVSRSMGWGVSNTNDKIKRMDVVQNAMRNVIRKLGGARNRLAIVTFSDVLRNSTSLTVMDDQGQKSATDTVNSLKADGGTVFSTGLNKAAEILDGRQEGDKDRLAFIIFLSDGEDPSFQTEKIPVKYPIHAFGISGGHQPQALEAMAIQTSGSYTSITQDLEKITEKLAQLSDRLTSVVAIDMRIDLTSAHPGVSLSRIESGDDGDKYKSDIRDDKLSGEIVMPALSSGKEREFTIYLDVPEGEADADVMEVLAVGCVYTQSWDAKKVDLYRSVVSVARPASEEEKCNCKELEWIEQRVEYWCKVKADLAAMYEMAEAEIVASAGNDGECKCQCQVTAALREASLESFNRAMHHDIYTAVMHAIKLRPCGSGGATKKVYVLVQPATAKKDLNAKSA